MSSLTDVAVSESRTIPPVPRARAVQGGAFKLALFLCLAFGVVALGTLLVLSLIHI